MAHFIIPGQVVYGADIYVAGNGEDRATCGKTPETPCKTVEGATARAANGDVILLDGRVGWNTMQFCKVLHHTDTHVGGP